MGDDSITAGMNDRPSGLTVLAGLASDSASAFAVGWQMLDNTPHDVRQTLDTSCRYLQRH
jgi:hypothetical protein